MRRADQAAAFAEKDPRKQIDEQINAPEDGAGSTVRFLMNLHAAGADIGAETTDDEAAEGG
jgi:hypothetical protein